MSEAEDIIKYENTTEALLLLKLHLRSKLTFQSCSTFVTVITLRSQWSFYKPPVHHYRATLLHHSFMGIFQIVKDT